MASLCLRHGRGVLLLLGTNTNIFQRDESCKVHTSCREVIGLEFSRLKESDSGAAQRCGAMLVLPQRKHAMQPQNCVDTKSVGLHKLFNRALFIFEQTRKIFRPHEMFLNVQIGVLIASPQSSKSKKISQSARVRIENTAKMLSNTESPAATTTEVRQQAVCL